MSEKFISHEQHEAKVIHPERQAQPERHHESVESVGEQRARQAAAAEEARRVVAEQAKTATEQNVEAAATEQAPQRVDNAAKAWRMRQSLSHVQKRLTPTQKSLSDFIHQPLVRRVSESTAQTVARPSGILGGGVFAFLGSSAYLWFAKTAGITYNYLGFFVFFMGGFLLGLVIEHLIAALRNHR